MEIMGARIFKKDGLWIGVYKSIKVVASTFAECNKKLIEIIFKSK